MIEKDRSGLFSKEQKESEAKYKTLFNNICAEYWNIPKKRIKSAIEKLEEEENVTPVIELEADNIEFPSNIKYFIMQLFDGVSVSAKKVSLFRHWCGSIEIELNEKVSSASDKSQGEPISAQLYFDLEGSACEVHMSYPGQEQVHDKTEDEGEEDDSWTMEMVSTEIMHDFNALLISIISREDANLDLIPLMPTSQT